MPDRNIAQRKVRIPNEMNEGTTQPFDPDALAGQFWTAGTGPEMKELADTWKRLEFRNNLSVPAAAAMPDEIWRMKFARRQATG